MKVSVKADFNKLVKAFEAAPEETRAAVRLQVKASARDIQEYAREHHKFITRGGDTEESIQMYAEGNTATVYLGSDVAVYQHEGTPPHIIKARNKLALRFVRNGDFVFCKRVHHPGIQADPYLFDAAEHERARIQSRFADAIESVLGRL